VSLFPSGRRNPFWSAIITQVQGSVSIAAGASAYIDIQPPVGETWWIHITSASDTKYISDHEYYDYDGTTRRLQFCMCIYTDYEDRRGVSLRRVLTNSLYGSLRWYNEHPSFTYTAFYGYSGFKLSQPLWRPRRLHNPEPKPWKRKLTVSLPSEISALTPYGAEIWDYERGNYIPVIILEEDTVLARDPATNFPVETLTTIITAENLVRILNQMDDPTLRPDLTLEIPLKYRGRKLRELTREEFEEVTGHKKYLEHWRREGISI